jgi:hypothetical protein
MVKACLHQSSYREAARYAEERLHNIDNEAFEDSGFKVTPIMQIKFELSNALARTALGETHYGTTYLHSAAGTLYENDPGSLTMDMSLAELIEDLESTIDNELIRLKSPWRCSRQTPLSPTLQICKLVRTGKLARHASHSGNGLSYQKIEKWGREMDLYGSALLSLGLSTLAHIS